MPPLGEDGACGAFGVPGRAERSSFEAVEQALGGKEPEAALVLSDDAGGAVVNFDDVGFGHRGSFAERVGVPVKRLRSGFWLGDQQRQQAPVAAETQRRIMRLRMSLLTRWSFDVIRRLFGSKKQFRCLEYLGIDAIGQ